VVINDLGLTQAVTTTAPAIVGLDEGLGERLGVSESDKIWARALQIEAGKTMGASSDLKTLCKSRHAGTVVLLSLGAKAKSSFAP
jgi:hypothetical protein